jgi:23S rRNA (adenine2503-C2)-methyltransferase
MNKKITLIGKNQNELEEYCVANNFPKFHGEQLFRWLYKNNHLDLNKMNNIPKKLKEKISSECEISLLKIEKQSISKIDKTIKFLLKTNDNKLVESVSMIDKKRHTVCISSQIGCNVDCDFCATGKMGIDRNLNVGEIIEQLIIVKKNTSVPITNIVFMGMGEPFLNYRNVIESCKIFSDYKAFNLGTKRITISTAGVLPQINLFIKEKHKYKLALSLNAPNDLIRDKIMPINKKWNISELISSLKKYNFFKTRVIMFEYVLLKGINDSIENAKELSKLLKNIQCKVNLIPFNQISGIYKRSDNKTINNFADILNKHNIRVLIRWSKGEDIDAACGQLATNHES